MNGCSEPTVSESIVTREVFDSELRELGEQMAIDGKIVIKQLLYEAEVNKRHHCLFDNWPARLKTEVYSKLGLEPVQMYRRVNKGI